MRKIQAEYDTNEKLIQNWFSAPRNENYGVLDMNSSISRKNYVAYITNLCVSKNQGLNI